MFIAACGEGAPTATRPPPTATPVPTATPTPLPPTPTPAPASLTGTGSAVLAATLGVGQYVVNVSVTGNVSSFGNEAHFAVTLGNELLANEIAAEWSGQKLIDVGGLWVEPGRNAVEITAEPGAQWTIEIQPF